MRIAIINMYATMGSTGTIAYGLFRFLKENGHEVILCYGRQNRIKDLADAYHDQSKAEEKLHGVLSALTGLQGYFSDCGTTKMLKRFDRFRPEAAILINIHSGFLHEERLWKYFVRHNTRVVYVMADEYAILGNCCYSYDCKQYLTGCEKCPDIRRYPKSLFFDVAAKVVGMKKRYYDLMGDRLSFVAPAINIEKAKVSYLLRGRDLTECNWGIDLEKYHPRDAREVCAVREKYGIPQDRKVVLAVGAFSDPRKGLKAHFLECARRTRRRDLLFVNVGYDGDEELPENFLPIGYVKAQDELCALFTLAELTVMPSRGETLPLTALMSLACGTPLCCFDADGLHFLGEGRHNRLVASEDTEALLAAVEQAGKDAETEQICIDYVRHNYLDSEFYRTVLRLASEDKG